jgi:hypothetical protein
VLGTISASSSSSSDGALDRPCVHVLRLKFESQGPCCAVGCDPIIQMMIIRDGFQVCAVLQDVSAGAVPSWWFACAG